MLNILIGFRGGNVLMGQKKQVSSRGHSEQTFSKDANLAHCICCLNVDLILSDGLTVLCPTVLMCAETLLLVKSQIILGAI